MLTRLQKLLDLIIEAPSEWFNGDHTPLQETKIDAIECTSYAELVEAWKDTSHEPGGTKKALHWSDNIDVAFSVMLAIIASTKLQGSQIWLRLIGPPGSAKSTLCEAISACTEYVYSMSMLTGFHSGYDRGDKEGSLIPEILDKTIVVNEGDMLLTAPNRDQILSELRDFYTGVTRARYRTGKQYEHKGIRLTFILAGTGSLRRLNRSSLGDRFLDCIVHERSIKGAEDKGERQLLKSVADMAIARCKSESNGELEGQDTVEKVNAIRRTAGFVKYLRLTSPQKVAQVEVPKFVSDSCINLAQLVAYMRARPDIKADGEETEVELATRLTEQFIRLAICLSIVLDRPIDSEVMRRVARVAKDTCKGQTFTIAESLLEKPLDVKGIEARTSFKTDTVRHYKDVMLAIGVIRADNNRAASGATRRLTGVYRLTPQMVGLLKKLYSLLGTTPKKDSIHA